MVRIRDVILRCCFSRFASDFWNTIMKFGKIQYLNMAAFDVFIKSYSAVSGFKKRLNLMESYPSSLNLDFLFRRIDAGFISSIAGFNSFLGHRTCPCGIVSSGAVWSVLVCDGDGDDYQSATSNALCKVLNLKGRVLIGDRALVYYQRMGGPHCRDMGSEWYDRHGLPFVFGLMCFNGYGSFYQRVMRSFLRRLGRCRDGRFKGIKIPHYVMMNYLRSVDVSKGFATDYLQRIYYSVGPKEMAGLNRFYRDLRIRRIMPPKRFGSRGK